MNTETTVIPTKEEVLAELMERVKYLEAELKITKDFIKELNGNKGRVNQGVKDFVEPLILEGLSNKEVHAKVCKHYGNENTTYACIAWYRNNLAKKGLKTEEVEI